MHGNVARREDIHITSDTGIPIDPPRSSPTRLALEDSELVEA